MYLDELRVHAEDIGREQVGSLLVALYEISDDLDIQEDEGLGFYNRSDNTFRIYSLTRALLSDRFHLQERAALLREAMQSAQLYLVCSLSERCKAQHERAAADHAFTPENERLVDLETAKEFIKLARKKLRAAVKHGSLVTHRRLFSLLWMWSRAAPKGLDEVRPLVERLLSNDDFVLHLASSAAGISWSISEGFDGMGDLVSRGKLHVTRESVSPLVDTSKFLSRLREIANKTAKREKASFVAAFIGAWESSDDH